jgi:hypothetical protein
MRVLGLALAGTLALTAPIGVQAGSLGPGSYSMPNGWDGDWRRAPGPSRQWSGGSVSPRWCPNCPAGGGACCPGPGAPLTGSGVSAAAPSIILSQTGEVRLGAGVIRSQPVLGPSGSGFTPTYEISYRGVKLSWVPAAFGHFQLRRLMDFPQVAQPSLR